MGAGHAKRFYPRYWLQGAGHWCDSWNQVVVHGREGIYKGLGVLKEHLLSRAPACMATAHPGIDPGLIGEAVRSYSGTRLGLGLQVAPPKHASWDGGPGLESRMKAAGLLARDGSGQLELARLSLGSTP